MGITQDRRLQLLLIAFSFGAFFEGAAGFGTPVAVTAAILIGLVTCERGPSRLLSAPWLMQLGAWSYTIYLTHSFCFDVTARLMPAGRVGDLLTLPAALLLDIPLVWFLHRYFERPMIELGRKLSSVSAPAPAIAVASVPADRRASPRGRRSQTV